jgi:hypothetical protein
MTVLCTGIWYFSTVLVKYPGLYSFLPIAHGQRSHDAANVPDDKHDALLLLGKQQPTNGQPRHDQIQQQFMSGAYIHGDAAFVECSEEVLEEAAHAYGANQVRLFNRVLQA